MTERSFSLEFHGWGASLSNWYARSADVLNRGAGGYNSRWLRSYLPRLLGNDVPDVTVLFIGNNDAIHEKEPQHVPLHEYKANILSILSTLYDTKPSMVVLMVTTTRVDEQLKPQQTNHRRANYAEVLRFIYRNRARADILGTDRIPQNMGLVDLWGEETCNESASQSLTHHSQHANNHEKFSITPQDLHDGSHLDVSGNKKVFGALKEVINMQFPQLSPDLIRPSVHLLRAKRSASGDLGTASGYSSALHHSAVESPTLVLRKKPRQHQAQQTDSGPSSDMLSGSPRSQRWLHFSFNDHQCEHTAPPPLLSSLPGSPSGAAHKQLNTSESNISHNKMSAAALELQQSHQNHARDPPLQWTVPRWRSLV